MNSQDHKKPVTSSGHDVHGVHLCHRCGWPFPNPHPSSRHRRAHKRVCGTIEGYKFIQSNLAVSDDEHASDDDEHTPSPKIEKRNVKESGSSGGVGDMSNKSEDDVFADAGTEFSESGISPSLEERLEIIGVNKSIEQKSVEGYVNMSQLKVNESAETTEQCNDPTSSGQTCNPGAVVNAIDQSGSVIPINDTDVEAVSAGLGNCLQLDSIKSESQRIGDVPVEEDKLASVSLDSGEGKTSDAAVMSIERKDEVCDKLDGSTHISAATNFTAVEDNSELEGVKVPLAGEDGESVLKAIGGEDVKSSVLNAITSAGYSDLVSIVSSDDVKVKQKTCLSGGEDDGNLDVSEGEKCATIGNKNMNQESKHKFSAETVSAPNLDNSFAPEDDHTMSLLKEDLNDYDEKSNCKILEAGNQSGEGAAMEAQVMLDSAQSVNSTDHLSSGEVDGDARHLEGLSKPDSSSLKSRDNDLQRSCQGFDAGKVTEVLQSIDSAGLNIGLNHDVGDVEVAKYVGIAGMAAESNHGDVASSERTPEQPISKDSINLFTESEFLSENSAADNSCTHDGAKASESIDAAKMVIEPKCDGSDVVLAESSHGLTLKVQESLHVNQKCLNETDAEKRQTTEDVSSSKFVGIVSGEELTCDDNARTPDKFLASPLLIEPIPASSDFQVLHEIYTNGDDKNIDTIKNVTGVDSKFLQDKDDDKLTKEKGSVSTMDISGGSSWGNDSLEGKWGSVSVAETNSQSSEKSETNFQNSKTTTGKGNHGKSDDFEPPSFMTLVQSGGEADQVAAASEIETVQNNQQPKSEALPAGWFPSLTNVVNESEGRKKNEEIIAKVTNWSPGKHHSPLKNLLNEAKSPNTKQVPAVNQKDETAAKDNSAAVTTVNSVLESDSLKDQIAHKEEWNSPARYPTEIKKEKKKGKPYWVPFVCCSSVNRDL